ncbi:bacterioferritin [Natronobacterium gregoryi]|nr:bacterioferritin [Natronobacterium gregoryi]
MTTDEITDGLTDASFANLETVTNDTTHAIILDGVHAEERTESLETDN